MNRLRNSGGFSLIEIMISLAIFGVGVLGLAGLIPVATKSLNRGADATEAHTIAQAKMEELENASGDLALDAGTHEDTVGGQYSRRWTITPDAPISGMTTIEVEVTWTQGGDEQGVVLSTSLLSGSN
jgi:prepilin-type N-terminal cleavage/methylation domain-containing protein